MRPEKMPSIGKFTVDMHTAVARAMTELSACVRSVGMYGREHPVAAELVDSAHNAVANLLITQPTVIVGVAESHLGIDRFVIEDRNGALAVFAGSLSVLGISEIKLSAGVTVEEIGKFAEIVSVKPDALKTRGSVSARIKTSGIINIKVKEGSLPLESREGKDPADIYEEAISMVEEALHSLQRGMLMPTQEIRAVVADSLHCLVSDENTLLALASIRSYDRYLSEHSVNVCIFSMVLARDLGLDAATTLEVGISAMLHDVGKVFVPSDIVKKAGRLTEDEWQLIRKHPADGAKRLTGLAELPALASTIALEHHAYCDGSGYPSFPLYYQTHLLSRLVAIIDTYDALTTDRPYRERWSPVKAIAYMLYEVPGRYDHKLLARFASRANLYPIGALVRLVSGDMAIVVNGNIEVPEKPYLRIIHGPNLKNMEKNVIDLSRNTEPAFEIETMAQPVEALLSYTESFIAA